MWFKNSLSLFTTADDFTPQNTDVRIIKKQGSCFNIERNEHKMSVYVKESLSEVTMAAKYVYKREYFISLSI